jgi:hypothetical protein
MLNFLDIVIGFAAVMLGAALIVTVSNQAISALCSHRGGNLLWGLRTLFGTIAPNALGLPVLTFYADDLAEIVVTHPLVSDSMFSTVFRNAIRNHPIVLGIVRRWQYATALDAQELRNTLQHVAQNRPAGMTVARHRLLAADIAVLLSPAGNLDQWFAAMQDRIKQRFTMWMRLWTVLFAAAIAGLGCIDTFSLAQELNRQANERASLVAAAAPISSVAQKVKAGQSTSVNDMLSDATEIMQKIRVANLNSIGFNVWSKYTAKGQKKQKAEEAAAIAQHKTPPEPPTPLPEVIAGVIGGWFLISLGAPFWFNALGSLSSLRPVLASKN